MTIDASQGAAGRMWPIVDTLSGSSRITPISCFPARSCPFVGESVHSRDWRGCAIGGRPIDASIWRTLRSWAPRLGQGNTRTASHHPDAQTACTAAIDPPCPTRRGGRHRAETLLAAVLAGGKTRTVGRGTLSGRSWNLVCVLQDEWVQFNFCVTLIAPSASEGVKELQGYTHTSLPDSHRGGVLGVRARSPRIGDMFVQGCHPGRR